MIVEYPRCPHCNAEFDCIDDDYECFDSEAMENYVAHYDVTCSHCKKSYQFNEVYEFSHYTMKDESE